MGSGAEAERGPLSIEGLRRELVAPRGPYSALDVVAETGSTNRDLALAAASGAADRTVLVAEHQTAGRGRAGRSWTSPPRSGLWFSVLLRPAAVPSARWGWLPLVAGVALAGSVHDVTGLDARLKWPNDLLAGPRLGKCAGILAEVAAANSGVTQANSGVTRSGQPGAAVVVGIGLNVTLRPAELPVPEATSLAIEGAATVDRDRLLVAILRELAADEQRWRASAGDADAAGLLARYRQLCATIGQRVRVELPRGGPVLGTAVDVDPDGRLVVRDDTGTESAISAGDVVHVRPARQ